MKRAVWLVFLLGAGLCLAQEGGTPNSEWMYVGNTWYDYQANGTIGRLIAVGQNGDAHFVWTNGLNYGSEQRQAFYNCWDESSGALLSQSGTLIGQGTRSGYPTLALHPRGIALTIYHDVWLGQARLAVANDFIQCAGAFTPEELEPSEPILQWPKIDVGPTGAIHIAVTSVGDPYQNWYMRAHLDTTSWAYSWEWDVPLMQIADENIGFPTIDIACSRHTDRVAVAWIEAPQEAGEKLNIFMRISEDGGFNWDWPEPVTGLQQIDTACVTNGGEATVCNGDTFSPYHDLSILFDENDDVHIAFSAFLFRYFTENEDDQGGWVRSTIWHWADDTEEFSLIGAAWYEHDSSSQIVRDLMCQKPSLAIDTTTGDLYCAFQQFDQQASGECGFQVGEYYLSVSQDNGRRWAVPTNVSDTPGSFNMQQGTTPSEQDIALAKYVTDGWIHALYEHDTWAGNMPQIECGHYLNSMVYMKTPIGDIPTTPLQERWAFRSDSTGFPFDLAADQQATLLPAEFTLYQNYPNPFNPSTAIQFDLAKAGNVKLSVFDVMGRTVATLVDEPMSAGAHTVNFDGANLTSGVYFARLEIGGASQARKMALIK